LLSGSDSKIVCIPRLPLDLGYLRSIFAKHLVHLLAGFKAGVSSFSVLKITNASQYDSEHGYQNSRERGAPGGFICGLLWFLLGSGLMCAAYCLVDEPAPSFMNKCFCLGIFICAVFSVGHGTILALE
jgi:hypothetical protein